MEKKHSPYIVNKSEELNAIRRRYGPRYFCQDEAIAKAAALWGAQCNDCGVVQGVPETVFVEHQRFKAEVRLYQTAKGFWFMGLSLTTSKSGFGTPPSVWEPCAFTDDMHARRWALDYLIHHLTFSEEHPANDPQKAAFIDRLECAKEMQLSLL